jgi:hypothetical protein
MPGLKQNKLFIIGFIFTFRLIICCQEQNTVNHTVIIHPAHLQLQYAGNLGLLSFGLGKSYRNEKVSLTLIYGFLPHFVNGVTVHTLAFKSRYNFPEIDICNNSLLGSYTGITILRGFTHNTFINLDHRYPKGYYFMNAIHASVFAGIRYKYITDENQHFRNISAYFEFNAIDYMIRYAVIKSYVTFWDIWDMGFGVNFDLVRIKFLQLHFTKFKMCNS